MAERKPQGNDLIFALDIGTRSVVGVVGKAVEDRFKVLAVEAEEHKKRAMLDGQIDNIQQVADLVKAVTERLERNLDVRLERVCVAAAGRALRTQTGSFALELTGEQTISAEQVSQLEAGAVSAAEDAMQMDEESRRQFFLVGYTVAQYRLDRYPLSTLMGHKGRLVEADVVATFLPGEVVESLYSAMRAAGLQVANMTLEPIAAMNAAIPAELRLLNLALVDIGAGTTDIAICRDGSVVGYTMVTLAGDEITETLMRTFLVDFKTAETLKRELPSGEDLRYTDILGIETTKSHEEICAAIEEPMQHLAEAICEQVAAVNGGAPSALFLAGGGSKLLGLREKIAGCLNMDEKRVAIAGNNYAKSAFSDDLKIENPEYATPLGIAISAGLGLLNDSYVVMLNGKTAKLFRSGTLTLRDILLMNGYTYGDMLGKSGKSLNVLLDGKHMVWRGEPFAPAVLSVNGAEAALTTVVHAGDQISFIPARPGADAAKRLADVLGADFAGEVLVNNKKAGLDTPLRTGDVILTLKREPVEKPQEKPQERQAPAPATEHGKPIDILFNGEELHLPGKESGLPYYLMDLLQYSDLDFEKIERPVRLEVNGVESGFRQMIRDGDSVTICYT
ncbi:cell division protein FtsA [Intestinimonas sp.]|uniref:cell division protein FtsA n=1 Tax=Intestinimonas sp. TaxID=1965293 RepID=UPI00260859F7|nr:cell division FtsA domain-containing protein [Intestinimonas sp.]